jgi:hypothetical protein
MDRFDLEQQILQCWNLCEDISTLAEGMMEQDLSTDQIVNVLNGLHDLYDIRFNKLFETFETLLREGQFTSTEE